MADAVRVDSVVWLVSGLVSGNVSRKQVTLFWSEGSGVRKGDQDENEAGGQVTLGMTGISRDV